MCSEYVGIDRIDLAHEALAIMLGVRRVEMMVDQEPFANVFGNRPGEFDPIAFLICAPNTVVGAVHSKAMHGILKGAAKHARLTGDAARY